MYRKSDWNLLKNRTLGKEERKENKETVNIF